MSCTCQHLGIKLLNTYNRKEIHFCLTRLDIIYLSIYRDFDKIVVGTSTKSVYLFSLTNTGLSRVSFETDADCSRLLLTNNICDVRFANNDSNVFFVGLGNGTISMHDLRTQQIVSKFEGKN